MTKLFIGAILYLFSCLCILASIIFSILYFKTGNSELLNYSYYSIIGIWVFWGIGKLIVKNTKI